MKKNNHLFAVDTRLLEDKNIFDYWYAGQRLERRERIDRFKFDSGKGLCLGAGIAMEEALKTAGCQNVDIRYNEAGKPYVDVPNVFFNISHTDGLAVCALSDSEVGVDVEKTRKFDKSLIEYTFSKDEILLASDKINKKISSKIDYLFDIDKFYNTDDCSKTVLQTVYKEFSELWTVKESVMKYVGLGLGLSPKEIEISIDSDILKVHIKNEIYESLSDNLNFTSVDLKDYHITICSEYSPFVASIEWIDVNNASDY